MIDLKLDASGDLEISPAGDISATESIVQAVRIRLLWFFDEWRLGPAFGFPYFENLFVKNPNEVKLRHLIRETVMSVEGVTEVKEISFQQERSTRQTAISIIFSTDEDTFREEVKIKWHNMD